jgi:hypothetical protein
MAGDGNGYLVRDGAMQKSPKILGVSLWGEFLDKKMVVLGLPIADVGLGRSPKKQWEILI